MTKPTLPVSKHACSKCSPAAGHGRKMVPSSLSDWRISKRGPHAGWGQRLAHGMDLFDSVSGQRLLKTRFSHGNTVKQFFTSLVGLQSLFLGPSSTPRWNCPGLQQVLGKPLQRKSLWPFASLSLWFLQLEVRHCSGVMGSSCRPIPCLSWTTPLNSATTGSSACCFASSAPFSLFLLGSFCLFFLFFLWFPLLVFGVSRVESERKGLILERPKRTTDASRRQASRVSGYGCVKALCMVGFFFRYVSFPKGPNAHWRTFHAACRTVTWYLPSDKFTTRGKGQDWKGKSRVKVGQICHRRQCLSWHAPYLVCGGTFHMQTQRFWLAQTQKLYNRGNALAPLKIENQDPAFVFSSGASVLAGGYYLWAKWHLDRQPAHKHICSNRYDKTEFPEGNWRPPEIRATKVPKYKENDLSLRKDKTGAWDSGSRAQ